MLCNCSRCCFAVRAFFVRANIPAFSPVVYLERSCIKANKPTDDRICELDIVHSPKTAVLPLASERLRGPLASAE